MTRRHLSLMAPAAPEASVTWSDFIGHECSAELAVLLRFASELHYAGADIFRLYEALRNVVTYESEYTLEADRQAEAAFAERAIAGVMRIMDPERETGS